MDMKKLYIAPETNVYIINVVSHLMDPSFVLNPEDGPEISDDDFEQSREENNTDNNRGNIWDNGW